MTKDQVFNFLDTCEGECDYIYLYLQGKHTPIITGSDTGMDILLQKYVIEIVSEDQTRLIAAFEYKDLQMISNMQLL
jgi:hypothetical protein